MPRNNHIEKCSRCGGESKVLESRMSDVGFRRRRACLDCPHRWTTLEIAAEQAARLEAQAKKSRDKARKRRKLRFEENKCLSCDARVVRFRRCPKHRAIYAEYAAKARRRKRENQPRADVPTNR